MTVAVRGRVPSGWNDQTARHITERLQALERALAGGAQVYVAPAVPAFGTGTVPGGGSSGGGSGGGSGVTDHGALTGLGDDDHPQYQDVFSAMQVPGHAHVEQEVHGLVNRFVERGEAVEPHSHGAQSVVGIENEFVRRGEQVQPEGHVHTTADIADFNPYEIALWVEIFGGSY